MRAVVVYESMFGNTRLIAEAIGSGLGEVCEVSVVRVADASYAVLAHSDLIVVGGPTHMHGMSRRNSRKMAAEMAAKPGSGVVLEPDATSAGLREWFETLGPLTGPAAAFDTRMPGPPAFTGRASRRISRLLARHGAEIVATPQSYTVLKTNALAAGELDRATEFGRRLGGLVAAVPVPVGRGTL